MAEQKEKLERRSSKSRLSKQDEVEEVEEEDNSPSSETSDATIVPAAGHETPVVQTPGDSPESTSPEETKEKKLESQKSTDSDKSSPTQGGHPKVKLLVRSHALCDDASPPPEEPVSLSTPSNTTTATLSVASLSPTPSHKAYRHRLEKDGSQSSVSEAGTSPCLSRDSSVETQYTDSTGIDLEEFIKMTLNKNAKDKMMLLKLEQDLTGFIKDSKHEYLKFPQMTSYHRMLVHRVAAFFGLDHNVDQSGKCVIVNRTANTRLPDFKFKEHVTDESSQEDQPKKQILKRESASFEEGRSSNRHGMDGKKSKSFEEREQEYVTARARIFNQESQSSQEGTLESPMRPGTRHSSARSSKEDLRWAAEPRPWSSTDSSGYGTDTSSKAAKLTGMTKASSFGGTGVNVTVLSRRDSCTSSLSGGRISKATTQDSLSSGVSSLGSPMTRPPPIPSSPPPDSQSVSESSGSSHSAPSPSHPPPTGESVSPGVAAPQLPFTVDSGQPLAVWVATSLDSIPAGSVLINPQTAQPYLNPDGSVYRYNPPPPSSSAASRPPQQGVPLQQQTQPQVAPMQALAPQFTQYQQPQVLVTSDHKLYSTDTGGGGDMAPQFSQMTLTHQSSTELAEPPGGVSQQQQQQQAQQQQPQHQQQMYMMTSPGHPASAQPGVAPPPVAPQPGYMQTPQMPYYSPSQPTSTPQVRYMYPNMQYGTPSQPPPLQTQGSIEGQGQSAPGQPNGHYSGQYMPGYSGGGTSSTAGGSYPVMGYPSMAVQTVETYQQPPTYPQGAPQPYPQGAPQTDMTPAQSAYSQYQGGSAAPSGSQPNYVQTQGPVYYSSPSTNGGSGVMTSVAFPTMTVQGHLSGQGSYRPRTPPNQASGIGSVGTSVNVNGVGTVGLAGGTYMPYASPPYNPQAVQTQRPQTPQVMPFQPMPHNHSPPQPPFPVVRPNMQMSMQMQTRTTPPPPPGGQYQHVAMVPTSQHVKMYGVDQRPPKSVELYNPEITKEPPGGVLSLQAPQVVALPKGGATMAMRPVAPVCPPYRQPTPMCPADVRLQLARPQLQPLFQPRPRMAAAPHTPLGASTSKQQKGRKSWTRSSKDSTSPPSSTEMTSSSVGAVLEVTGLPPGMKQAELEATCDDLIKQGVQLQVIGSDSGASKGQWDEAAVLAVFDCESSAQRALASHTSSTYRLRLPSRHFDLTTSECPS